MIQMESQKKLNSAVKAIIRESLRDCKQLAGYEYMMSEEYMFTNKEERDESDRQFIYWMAQYMFELEMLEFLKG